MTEKSDDSRMLSLALNMIGWSLFLGFITWGLATTASPMLAAIVLFITIPFAFAYEVTRHT